MNLTHSHAVQLPRSAAFPDRSNTRILPRCENSTAPGISTSLRPEKAALRFLFATVLATFVLGGRLAAADLPRTTDHAYDPPVPGSYALPKVKAAADGDVLASTGRPFRLREFTRGRVTVLSFIYTRCAAARACPYATGVLRQLYQLSAEDAELAQGMRLVSMSFDPIIDTPERMAAYAALADSGSSAAQWHFLTSRSMDKLQPILDAYGQAVDKKKNPLDPTGPLNHTLRVYLIDANGNIRNIYSSDTLDLRLVLADVRTLLLERRALEARIEPADDN